MQTENKYIETDLGNVSLNPRGEYDADASYEYLDLVSLDGGSYVCAAEFGTVVTGVSPIPGETTETWQCIAIPGEATEEFKSMVILNCQYVEQSKQNASTALEAKQAASNSAANSAESETNAKKSESNASNYMDAASGHANKAAESEEAAKNARKAVDEVAGKFPGEVKAATAEAEEAVAEAKQAALEAVLRQQSSSIEEVKKQTQEFADKQKAKAKQEIQGIVDGFDADIEAIKADLRTAGDEQVALIETKGNEKAVEIANAGDTEVAAVNEAGLANVETVNTAKTKALVDIRTAVSEGTQQIDSAIQIAVSVANTAAESANQAASTANTAAENADKATEKTNAAVKNATDAANQATQAASSANEATENANQATAAAKAATQAALAQADEAKQAAASVRDDCYPMMFRNYDGRTYSVFFEDADETMVCTGTKEDDNADIATPVPSTNAVRNENPYDEIPLFKPIECNGYVDDNGELHITAVKGEPEFRSDGTKGDVCIALKTGYIRTIIDTVGIMGPLGKKGTKISVTDSLRESEYPGFPFIPYTAAIRPDGSVRPYVLIPKYQAVNFNGSYYSLPGFAPAYNVSHNGQITTFQKRGSQYCGETCSDAEIWETLFMIVFANMNSQAVMVGCTGFGDQYMAAVAEENVERIILTKKQAEYFPIGCCVSIGEMGSSTNKDRSRSYMHNLANRVKVTKIEALNDDSGNYALYVDNGGVTFNTSATTCVSTMPWHTGSTDKVKGTCGSPYSNTNGKEPFKFLGIEFALGQYVVRSDVILNGVYDAEADTYQQEIYTCYDCKYFATEINEHYKMLGYVIPDSGNAWKYIKNLGFDVNFPHIRMASEYGGDSNKRFGDAVHTGTRASGTREFLSLGPLWDWSFAGLRFASLNLWLGGGSWYVSARPSLTGRRGSVADWASSMGVNLAA